MKSPEHLSQDGFAVWRIDLRIARERAENAMVRLLGHETGTNPLDTGAGGECLDAAMRIIALLEDAGLDIGRDSEGKVYIKNALGN